VCIESYSRLRFLDVLTDQPVVNIVGTFGDFGGSEAGRLYAGKLDS